MGGDFHWYTWPMWGFFQNRGYYQYTNGYTTEFGFNDGSGSGFASMLLSLPAVKQRQAGVPQMNLRNWGTDAFIEDSWQVTANDNVEPGRTVRILKPALRQGQYQHQPDFPEWRTFGVRRRPERIPARTDVCEQAQLCAPYRNRQERSESRPRASCIVWHLLHARGPEYLVQPAAQCAVCISGNAASGQFHSSGRALCEWVEFWHSGPGYGSATGDDGELSRHSIRMPRAQYVQQWNGSVQKSLGKDTSIEIGYLGSRGFHLQRAHLINNTLPGPGPLGPRRPFKTLTFVPGTKLPPGSTTAVIQS